jgi:hypothetical protein
MRFLRFILLFLLLASVVLSALHNALPTEIALGSISIPVRSVSVELWHKFFIPLGIFLGAIAERLISWPTAAVVITILLLWNGLPQALLPLIFSRLRKITMPGIQLELSEQIQELKKESDDLNQVIPVARDKTNKRVQDLVKELRVQTAAENMVKGVVAKIQTLNPKFDPNPVRSTIYISDVLFDDHLLQLLDYIGSDGKPLPGSRSGRRFSMRYGIIGRVWRSRIAEIEGILPEYEIPPGTPTPVTDDERVRYIARIWGMTIDEARGASKYPSYVCIPFPYGGKRQALFYMDSSNQNAFLHSEEGHKKELIESVGKLATTTRLDLSLGDLDAAPNEISPKINILDTNRPRVLR